MRKKSNGDFKFDFSSLDFDFDFGESKEIQKIPKLNTKPVLFENALKMAHDLDWGSDYIAFVGGSFIFGDFLEALCLEKQLKPKEIYITTLGMSKNNVDSIVNLVDYLGAKKVNLIVSHYFSGVERHNIIPYMEQEFAGRPIKVGVLQAHCKIIIIRSDKGDAVICGSANLSSSNNVEQFIIMHSAEAIDFVQSKLDNIMGRFTVIDGMNAPKMDWNKNKGNTGKKAFEKLKGV